MERVDYESIVTQDLINLHKNNELDISPWYQRRSVWTRPQKAYLVNTIFEKKPVPTIYVRHYLDIEKEKSIKEIVDGQQRVRTVLEYAADEFHARHPNHKGRKKFTQLSATERRNFLMTKLSIGYLIDADDRDVIEIFGRLNSISKTLNSQEKRNAKFSGEMKQFCLKQASQRVQFWRDSNLFSANDIARMNEVQFVSDLVLNMLNGLTDFSTTKLDYLYEKYDEEFPHEDELEGRMEKVFSKLASINLATIRDTIFSRHPLFFSLFFVFDSIEGNITSSKLGERLHAIDEKFNADIPVSERNKSEADFYLACTSSTQRIKSRKIRDAYIRKALKIS